MPNRFVSQDLLNECPAPFLHFLWYLWDVYCDPNAAESLFLLQAGERGQRVTILSIPKTVEQDFGVRMDAIIRIRKTGENYDMSRL